MVCTPALLPLATSFKVCPGMISPYDESLCSEADIPVLDLDAVDTPEYTSKYGNTTSQRSVIESLDSVDSSPVSSLEDSSDNCTLVDAFYAMIQFPRGDLSETGPSNESPSINATEASSDAFALPNEAHDGGVTLNPDVDFAIEGPSGSLTTYPVYTCHHIANTNKIILSQAVLSSLQKLIRTRDTKLHTSRLLVTSLSSALHQSEHEKLALSSSQEHAQKAEATAVSRLQAVSQEAHTAQSSMQLLQQALQLAQRGYTDAREDAATLHRALERANTDTDKAHQGIEALHSMLRASRVEMMNMRKDHDFTRTQSKGYLRSMQQSIDSHEAARLQLLEQKSRNARAAAEKIAALEKRNAELENMLAVRLHITRQSCGEDVHIDMPSVDSSETIVEMEEEEDGKSGWGLGLWRVRSAGGIDDLESGAYPHAEPGVMNDHAALKQQGVRNSSWGVKSLRLRGVWGGRI